MMTEEEERHTHTAPGAVSAAHAIANEALAEAQHQQLQARKNDQATKNITQDGSSNTNKEVMVSSPSSGRANRASQQPPAISEASAHDGTAPPSEQEEAANTATQKEGDEREVDDATALEMQVNLFGGLGKKKGDRPFIINDEAGGADAEGLQIQQKLQAVWRFALEEEEDNEEVDEEGARSTTSRKDAEKIFQKAYHATLSLVGQMVDSIVQDGLQAYHQMGQKERELVLAQETMDSKDQELERLRETNANHRKTIQNLLRALEKTKTDAKDASQEALVETKLRSEVSAMAAQKENVLATASDLQHKYKLLEDELRQTKAKLTKVEQDKVKLERDRRATMSWAKSVDNHMTSDCDFYKRKVTDQNTRIQGLNAVIAEKNSVIDEMRRRIERSMSNNRLAQFRSSQAEHANKKSRKRPF